MVSTLLLWNRSRRTSVLSSDINGSSSRLDGRVRIFGYLFQTGLVPRCFGSVWDLDFSKVHTDRDGCSVLSSDINGCSRMDVVSYLRILMATPDWEDLDLSMIERVGSYISDYLCSLRVLESSWRVLYSFRAWKSLVLYLLILNDFGLISWDLI